MATGEAQSPLSRLFERLEGITSGLADRAVLVGGAGSVGSQIAENLTRSGVGRLVLIDPDEVDEPNISRAVYTTADLGLPKVDALERRLRLISPAVKVETKAMSLQRLGNRTVSQLVADVDLVVAATDDRIAQLQLDHHAYAQGVPAVFPSVYARGHAGEVAYTVPGVTRCFRCATASRSEGGADGRATDYGTGRLAAEPALGADIQHIVSIASRIAVAQLELASPESPLASFLIGALTRRLQLVVIANVPDYGFFPQVFDGVSGQWAFQTTWLAAVGDERCAVCGEARVDPTILPDRRAPDVTRLVELDQE